MMGFYLEDRKMQKYYKITNPSAIAKIKEALKARDLFFDNLDKIEKKYGAETSLIFHSFTGGLSFSCLWFKEDDKDKIDTSLFKVSYHVRNKYGEYGHEVRPRKSNKKFYNDFMSSLKDFSYLFLSGVLFGLSDTPNISIEMTDKDDYWLLSTTIDLILPHEELTATQYLNFIK